MDNLSLYEQIFNDNNINSEEILSDIDTGDNIYINQLEA